MSKEENLALKIKTNANISVHMPEVSKLKISASAIVLLSVTD